MKKSLLIITFLLSLCMSAQIYVDASATGNNNGSSWANAYTDINIALLDPSNNEYWVASGIYKPENTVNSSIDLRDNQEIYGGFNGTEISRSQRDHLNNPTILSGDQLDNDTNNGLTYDMPERSDNNFRILRVVGLNVIIDGFTIQDGSAEGSSQALQQGAAGIINTDTTLRNCIIKNNVSERGGAIVSSQNQSNGTVVIENCIFENNLASFAPAFYATNNIGSTFRFTNVQFTKNTTGNAVGQTGFGGVIWLRLPSATATMVMTNCTISDNDYQNSTTGVPANIRVEGAGTPSYSVYNSIFWNNGVGYKAITNSGNSANLFIVNNLDEDNFSNISSAIQTTVSDPLFIDALNNDYSLSMNSPAIEAGDSSFYSAQQPSVDYLGNTRIQGFSIDLGAYESSVSNLSQPILYVDSMAAGVNDGSSWQNAFASLQDALDATTNNDIWVKAGTYLPGTTTNSTFTISGRDRIYGGFNGTETDVNQRDPEVNPTILSGDLNGNDNGNLSSTNATLTDNAIHVVTVTASGATLDGITIQNGFANINTGANSEEGSGILVNQQVNSLNLIRCIIKDNFCSRAGAVQINAMVSVRLNINRTRFTGNVARFAPALYTVNQTGSPMVSVTVNNSLFDNNSVTNTASGTASSIIIWNRAEFTGSVEATYTNCTFAQNTIPTTGHIILGSANQGRSSVEVENSIFWGNAQGTSPNFPVIGNTTSNQIVAISNSLSLNGFSNHTNKVNTINSDPLFTDLANGDYTLTASSPAINSGDNQFVNLTEDFAGNNRIANTTVDMGAYEFGATAGIEENSKLKFVLYPNPASNILNVSGNITLAKAEIYNLQGQQVAISKTEEVQVQGLKTGMYVIRVTTQNGDVASQQFIKK